MASKIIQRHKRAAQIIATLLPEYLVPAETLLVETDPSLHDHVPGAHTWHTRYTEKTPATALPATGRTYATIIIRLPTSHDRFDFVLRSALYCATPETTIYIYGFNDEGIKGASKKCAAFFGACTTVGYKKGCRLLSVIPTHALITEHTRTPLTLTTFASTATITTPDTRTHTLTYYPGMFAAGALDAATALLLAHIPPLPDHAHVLDYGCGSGIIARDLGTRYPTTSWSLLDSDALAIAASKKNCNTINVTETYLINTLPEDALFDHIISNPPMHSEKDEHTDVITRLITEAPSHLALGGTLTIVVQSRLALTELFTQHFTSHTTLAQTPHFTVWRAHL